MFTQLPHIMAHAFTIALSPDIECPLRMINPHACECGIHSMKDENGCKFIKCNENCVGT